MATGSADMTSDLVRGRLEGQAAGMIELALPGTDYRLSLATSGEVKADAVGQVSGRVRARARRVDVIRAGGRYVEPVFGRPRRLQGSVVAVDAGVNTITVYCGCPFICELTSPGQRAEKFEVGQMVSFDVERGARFEVA
ncbi:MAG: hypothetical protein IT441_01815 [Phycisphaeraceae bacterium]|nr:hypothetical protein [Phycisphaeraceae bacterium]